MNKLFKLKKWLTLEETSRRLTTSFQESVSVADCLQLALDGHIKISVLIENSKYGVLCKEGGENKDIISGFIDFIKKDRSISDEVVKTAESNIYPQIHRYGSVFSIPSGVYDLPMIGAERLDVLHECSLLQNREPGTYICLEGPFLNYNDGFINVVEPFNESNVEWKIDFGVRSGLFDRKHNQYIDESNYFKAFHPADGLRDVTFVFRRDNIEAFENSQSNDSENNVAVNLDGCLEIIGLMLDSLKSTSSKGKRWTQDALKSEMTEKGSSLSPRSIDDYFSSANKHYKSKR